jgi:hypothetical protein
VGFASNWSFIEPFIFESGLDEVSLDVDQLRAFGGSDEFGPFFVGRWRLDGLAGRLHGVLLVRVLVIFVVFEAFLFHLKIAQV